MCAPNTVSSGRVIQGLTHWARAQEDVDEGPQLTVSISETPRAGEFVDITAIVVGEVDVK